MTTDSLIRPRCTLNSTRIRCNIEIQLSISNCNLGEQNTDQSNTDRNIGKYALGAIVGAVIVVLLASISLSFSIVYRKRRRDSAILTMEHPVENPLAVIIEERSQNI